jgi:uncharacterized lipoprotein YajG
MRADLVTAPGKNSLSLSLFTALVRSTQMARHSFLKAASSLAAILILAAGCSQSPTAVELESSTASASTYAIAKD